MKQKIAHDAIIGVAAVDWVTLTTFNAYTHDRWASALVDRKLGKSTPAERGGYKGITLADGQIFMGLGRQGNLDHWMLVATGPQAQRTLLDLHQSSLLPREHVACTRIDIQITLLPRSGRPALIQLATDLNEGNLGPWKGRGRPQVRGFTSETGDTLYIGSPTSDKQIRVYDKKVKPKGARTMKLERYEVQYRRKMAESVFRRVVKYADRLDDVYMEANIKATMQPYPDGLLAQLAAWDRLENRHGEGVRLPEVEKQEGAEARWIRSIARAIKRACCQQGADGASARAVLMEALAVSVTEDVYADGTAFKLLSPDGEVLAPHEPKEAIDDALIVAYRDRIESD